MGEAKRRKARQRDLLNDGAVCIFCGGIRPATTVDHVPPRVMFDRRHRPKGMEFPACAACNDGSRKAELVAGTFARAWPDAEPHEVAALVHAVKNNVPGLLEELAPSKRQKVLFHAQRSLVPKGVAGILNASGPILNQSMLLFGAKLGMALFFHDLDRTVPPEGAVFVRWYSNHDAVIDRLPTEILQMMGAPASLRQGKWSVDGQFTFRSAIPVERTMAAHVAVFRDSIGILTFTAADARHMDNAPQEHIFRPGCLRAP